MILKTCSSIIFALVKAVSVLLLVALLTPFAYFALRACQPMDRLEFHKLTYYRLLSERQDGYDQLAYAYQSSHPTVKVKTGMCLSWMCSLK